MRETARRELGWHPRSLPVGLRETPTIEEQALVPPGGGRIRRGLRGVQGA